MSGELTTSDGRSPIKGSSYYCDRYTFSGTAGQQVAIQLTSSAFDTYLYLIDSSGRVVAEDDDGGGGTNSRIPPRSGHYTLPFSGSYTIEVTSRFTNRTGSYTLSLSGPTAGTPPSGGKVISGAVLRADGHMLQDYGLRRGVRITQGQCNSNIGVVATRENRVEATVPVYVLRRDNEVTLYVVACTQTDQPRLRLDYRLTFMVTRNTKDDPKVRDDYSVAWARFTPLPHSGTAQITVPTQDGLRTYDCGTRTDHRGHDAGCIVPQEAIDALIDYVKQQPQFNPVHITLTFVPGEVPRAGGECPGQVNTDPQSLKGIANSFEVPYLVLYNLLLTESPRQFDRDCYTLVTYDGGVGVAQLTGATFEQLFSNQVFISRLTQYCAELRPDGQPSSVYNCLARSLQANVAGGVQVLNSKWDMIYDRTGPVCWHTPGTVQQRQIKPRQIISNWVLPVAAYKGYVGRGRHGYYLTDYGGKVREVFRQVVQSEKWSTPVYVETYDVDAPKNLSDLPPSELRGSRCTMASFWRNP